MVQVIERRMAWKMDLSRSQNYNEKGVEGSEQVSPKSADDVCLGLLWDQKNFTRKEIYTVLFLPTKTLKGQNKNERIIFDNVNTHAKS